MLECMYDANKNVGEEYGDAEYHVGDAHVGE